MNINAARKLDWDFIKGVLMFIVIWGHICPNSSDASYVVTWNTVSRVTGLFVMPLFFFVSGYFFKPVYSMQSFMKKQINIGKRIGIPLLLWGVLSYFSMNVFNHTEIAFSLISLKQCLMHSLYFLWYLSALILCVATTCFISMICGENRRKFGFLSVGSIFIFCFLPLDYFHFSFVWLFYVSGIYYRMYESRCMNRKQTLSVGWMIILTCLLIVIGVNYYPEYTFYLLDNQIDSVIGGVK